MINKKNKPILVATDFSDESEMAIKTAVQLVEKSGQRIILFHSCYFNEVKNSATLLYPEAVKESMQLAQQKIEKIIRNYSTKNNKILFESHVQFGDSAPKEIIAASKRKKAELIIAGTKGASNIKKKIFDTTAIQILQQSKIPVLTVPSIHKKKPFDRLIYFTDLLNTKNELDIVINFSNQYQLAIEAVFLDAGWAETLKETDNLRFLDQQKIQFHHERVRVEDSLAMQIRNYMKRKNGGIACLFHKNRNLFANLFGGNISPQVMRKMDFPLLVFPKKED